MIWNPYPRLDHYQKLITSRGSPFCPWLPCLVDVRYLAHSTTDRMTEWENEGSHYSANLGGLTSWYICYVCFFISCRNSDIK